MIRSMTGYGAASGDVGGRRITVEARSVNHRFFNATIRLGGDLARYEWEVREAMKKRVVRGHVTVTTRFDSTDTAGVAIDEARVAAWVEALRHLKERHQLAGDVDLATIVRLPDVFGGAAASESQEGSALVEVVERAVDELRRSREVEGGKLAAYLLERLASVEAALGRIAVRAPERVVAHRDRVQQAVAELSQGVQVDPQRLAVEIALLAERLDVGEELSRFQAHIAAFRNTLATPPADGVGKRLGFLLQEMLREANTTGSKSNDVVLTGDVVTIKEELERMREQVENLE